MKRFLATLGPLCALVCLGAFTIAPTRAASLRDEPPILGEPTYMTPLVATPGVEDNPDPPPVSMETPAAAAPAGSPTPTTVATSTPAPSERPDRCEPNDTPAQACPLTSDGISPPFTINPDEDQDFYRLDLVGDAALQTDVTLRSTGGIDLYLTARQGEAIIASGTVSLTLAPAISGPVVLRVENREPRSALGETYRLEVRRTIAPSTQSNADAAAPDALENNWSPATAAPIAVGVIYDLTLVCPEARADACPGGDHDYLAVPVKVGITYLFATFDLDPGLDTVLELFWPDDVRLLAGSDDFSPGGQLAALTWTAPRDGTLLVRIAPRNGGLAQRLAPATRQAYRVAVAPLASELATTLDALIRQQANVPTPTPVPVSASDPGSSGGSTGGNPPPSSGGMAASQESIAGGPAIILRETVLRRSPQADATALVTLAPESLVTVRGPVSGLWISVESDTSILPGWVRWSELQRLGEGELPGFGGSQGAGTSAPTEVPLAPDPGGMQAVPPSVGGVAPTAPAAPTELVSITALDPALPPPLPPVLARVPVTLSVRIVATDRPPTSTRTAGAATPTPDLRQPLGGVRVQLCNVFGDVLAEGLTDAQGAVRLSRDLAPNEAIVVQLPAWGLSVPLAPAQTTLLITAPEARR